MNLVCDSLFIDRYLYKSRGGKTLPPSNHDAHDESLGKSWRGNRSSRAHMGSWEKSQSSSY